MLKDYQKISGAEDKDLLKVPLMWFIGFYFIKGLSIALVYYFIAELTRSKDMIDFYLLSGVFVIMIVLSLADVYLAKRSQIELLVAFKISAKTRLRLGDHLRKLSLGFFKKKDPGELTGLLLTDLEQLESIFCHIWPDVVAAIVFPCFICAAFLFINWRITLVIILFIGIALLVFKLTGRVMDNLSRKQQECKNKAVGRMMEYVFGIKGLKSHNMTGKRFSRLDRVFSDLRDRCIKTEAGFGPIVIFYNFILHIGFIFVLIISVDFFLKGIISLPDVLIFVVLSYHLFFVIGKLGVFMAMMKFMKLAGNRVEAIIKEKIQPGTLKTDVSHHSLEFRNVSFKYLNKNVLKNVNFTIPEKKVTALVGHSGSGKTTLANLTVRLWDVHEGEILFSGKNINLYEPDDYLSHFSMVFQDVYLFHDTIMNNIKVGDKDATEEQVIEAAKKARCHDFIKSKPDGYETIVGEGGATLSGGEKQRISIARAILKDAPVIVLDEATASLDPENELDIQKAINGLIKNKTLIMIAHRLNTIKKADQIVVLEGGRINGKGTHEELIRDNAIYQLMWNTRQISQGWKFSTDNKKSAV